MRLILLTLLTSFCLFAADDFSDLLSEEKRTIHIYSEVAPSVVGVSNIRVAKDMFYGETKVPVGSGTGFVWDTAGHIVTNYHVVQGGDDFVISFQNDKKQYRAKIVGVAPSRDIAVLKLVKKPTKLKAITPGTSKDLLVGQMSLAVGNPMGLDYSISKGIISALGRKIDGIGGVKIHDMIQTDAAINRGNSGGPLLDSRGRLIGMNTMIFSSTGSNAGLGFAVPVDTVNRTVPQLIEHGKIIRPMLGVTILDESRKATFRVRKGVVITGVIEGSAAAKAGLTGLKRDEYSYYLGDVILKVDGKEVDNLDDIYTVLEKRKIGDEVSLTYRRGKNIKKTKIKLKQYDF